MIEAYVLGRPMPFSSSSLTSVASVKRGGGCVNFCSGRRAFSSSRSPSVSGGSMPDTTSSSPSVFSVDSGCSPGVNPYVAIQPANFGTVPFTRNVQSRAVTSTIVSSNVAGVICDATKRFQTSRYNEY